MAKKNVFVSTMAWEPPPAKTPGEKFRRSDSTKFKVGTPRPFLAQQNFKDQPGIAMVEAKPAGSPVTKSEVGFVTPPSVKTPCYDKGCKK